MAGYLIDFSDIYRILLNKKDVVDTAIDFSNYLKTLYLMCAKVKPNMRRVEKEILQGRPFSKGLRAFLYLILNDCLALLLDAIRMLPERQIGEILNWLLDFLIDQLGIPMPELQKLPVIPQVVPETPVI